MLEDMDPHFCHHITGHHITPKEVVMFPGILWVMTWKRPIMIGTAVESIAMVNNSAVLGLCKAISSTFISSQGAIILTTSW